MPKKPATAAVTGFDVLIDPQSIQPAAVTVIVGDDVGMFVGAVGQRAVVGDAGVAQLFVPPGEPGG